MGEPVQPSGTVTFLFTDIEDHTQLWEEFPDEMPMSLERHDRIMREAIGRHGGYVFSTAGDAFGAAFPSVESASTAAVEAQQELRAARWPDGGALRVRMGLHTGEAQERDGDYFGPAVIRAARLMSLGHGGQVLVSAATACLLAEHVEYAPMLVPLGEVELRGLLRLEHISELRYPGLDTEFPHLVSAVQKLGNLTRISDELIGRAQEVTAGADLVESSSLVTLVGPGGVGKTRLSIEIGSFTADRFSDGVWFVALAPVADASAVPDAVADVLGVQETAGRSLIESIVGAITGRNLLVILDNCEHVTNGARDLVRAIVDGCDTVTLMATSREALMAKGERVLPVEPLPVDSTSSSMMAPAAELFVARAQAADPGLAIDEAVRESVSEICRRLDGMPLAIELAAARVRGLGLDGLAVHLDDRFRLLRRRGGTVARHQTLSATVGWSYELLDDWLRELFCRAGLFAGGFTREAAEQVLAFGELDSLDVADGLGELVDKSMIQVVDAAGASRYRMLETMRQFGAGEIADASRVEAQRRFVDYYVAHVNDRTAEIIGPAVRDAISDLRLEYDNVREAFRLAVTSGSHDAGAQIVTALHEFANRAVVGESYRWAQELAERLKPTDPGFGDVLAVALYGARGRGDRQVAAALAGRLEAAEQAGELQPSSFTDHHHGMLYWFWRDTPRSVALQERALTKARATEEAAFQAQILATLSMAQDSFDRERARASAEAALEIAQSLDSPLLVCQALLALGGVVVHDDQTRACELAEEIADTARAHGLLWFEATGVRLHAHASSRLGDLETASALYLRALDLNGVGDYGELLWYTIINVVEHLWRIAHTDAAAVALGALTAAPAAPSDDLVNRATLRLRERLVGELGPGEAELEETGRSMRLADLLRLLHDRLAEHSGASARP